MVNKISSKRLFANCDFVASYDICSKLPNDNIPEFAFVGKSNVGKSSLINSLTNRKNLARTSNTPGRTQLINFFSLSHNNKPVSYIVDMPGYGYAKVSQSKTKSWGELIRSYLCDSYQLKLVFLLIDARRGIKENDIMMMDMMDEYAINFQIVYTKCDKAKKKDIEQLQQDSIDIAGKHPACYPEYIFTSSRKGIAMNDIRSRIVSLL